MPGRPVDEETRKQVVVAHGEGKSRNAIAKEFGIAGQTVTRICAEAGLSFDRTQTTLAVRARSVDLADARLLLAQKMVVAAQDALDDLDAPYLVFNFGGKDNTFEEHLLDGPPEEVRRSIMTTAGIAFDKATKAVESVSDEGNLTQIKAALLGFRAGLEGVDFDDDANFSGPQSSEGDESQAGAVGS